MRKIIWLESAANDLVCFRKFIAEKNPIAAKNAADIIRSTVKLLANNSDIGKPVSNLAPYRDVLARFGAGGYVIRYRVNNDAVYIVHVRHYRENDFKS